MQAMWQVVCARVALTVSFRAWSFSPRTFQKMISKIRPNISVSRATVGLTCSEGKSEAGNEKMHFAGAAVVAVFLVLLTDANLAQFCELGMSMLALIGMAKNCFAILLVRSCFAE